MKAIDYSAARLAVTRKRILDAIAHHKARRKSDKNFTIGDIVRITTRFSLLDIWDGKKFTITQILRCSDATYYSTVGVPIFSAKDLEYV